MTLGALAAAALMTASATADARAGGVAAAARALAKDHFEGVVVIGRARGSTELARGFGGSDTPATVFDIGSVAKLFTATAVLRLEEDGKLSLDRSIATYLPRVPAAERRITVRELLLHTSGLPGDFASDLAVLTRIQATRRILSLPLHPAGRFVYSNAGYVLLASIVEQVGGMPFRRYVRLHVLAPARVAHIGWYADPQIMRLPRAVGYVRGVDRGVAGGRPLSWSILGAGGMIATAPDLFRFCSALTRGHILDRKRLAELDSGYATLPRQGPPARIGYGGIVASTPSGGTVAAVGGGTDFGFTADVRRYLSAGLISIVLSNSDRVPAANAGSIVEQALGL